MSGVPIIDLDRVAPGPQPEERRGRRTPAVPRAVLVLAVVLVALTGLGPAGSPEPLLRMVLAANGTPAAAFELGADSLYTASYGINNPNSESGVRRFDLTDGSERWATALPQGVQHLAVAEGAGVLMARSGNAPKASFLDTATGAVLWQLESANTSVVTLARGGALITTAVPGGSELRLADPRTGGTIWSRRLEERVSFGPDALWSGTSSRIVAVSVTGSVTTLDFATGAVLSAGRLDGPLRVDSDRVDVLGADRLVVSRGGATSMTAYTLVPFARAWRTASSAEVVADCGVVWCVVPPSVSALRAIDPATGAQRWQTTEVTSGGLLADGTLAGLDALETPRMSVLDPATGRVLRRLGEQYRVGDLLLHTDSRAPSQAWVSRLSPDGTPRALGRVDTEVPFGCEAEGRHLACPTAGGPTKVWRVPAG